MATNARGQTVLDGTPVTRASIQGLLLQANDIRPVANVTARAQLVADLTAAGLSPTPARPLYVDRADAYIHQRLESTVDGTTWIKEKVSRTVGHHTLAANSAAIGSAEVGIYNAVANGVVGMGHVRATFNGRISGAVGSLLNLRLVIGGVEIAQGQTLITTAGGSGQITLAFSGWVAVAAGTYNVDLRGRTISGGAATIVAGATVVVEEYSL